jgi:hypothetical protein
MRDYRNGINQMRDLYNYQHHDNLIIRQPQLSSWFITIKGNLRFHDVTIWCKCIKTKVYKEAIIKLGFDRYKKFVSWAEDTSVNIIILYKERFFYLKYENYTFFKDLKSIYKMLTYSFDYLMLQIAFF